MLRLTAVTLALLAVFGGALGIVLFVAGLFSGRTTRTDCTVVFQGAGRSIEQMASDARGRLRADGHDTRIFDSRTSFTLKATTDASFLSIVGIHQDEHGPELEAAMASVTGKRPHCLDQSLLSS